MRKMLITVIIVISILPCSTVSNPISCVDSTNIGIAQNQSLVEPVILTGSMVLGSITGSVFFEVLGLTTATLYCFSSAPRRKRLDEFRQMAYKCDSGRIHNSLHAGEINGDEKVGESKKNSYLEITCHYPFSPRFSINGSRFLKIDESISNRNLFYNLFDSNEEEQNEIASSKVHAMNAKICAISAFSIWGIMTVLCHSDQFQSQKTTLAIERNAAMAILIGGNIYFNKKRFKYLKAAVEHRNGRI